MKRILATCFLCSSFLTNLQAQTVVLSEDFQNGIPGATWTVIVNDTNTVDTSVSEYAPGWISVTDPDNPADTVAAATSFFRTPGRANRWLITPSILLGAYGNILKWEARSQDPSFPDGYMVMISTTDTQISSFTDTLTLIYPESDYWTTREINLSDSGYINQNVFIAFVLRTYDAYKLYIDDISLRIDDPVGITELAQPNSVLYPNPVTTNISIKGDQPERIKIYSATGRLMLEQAATQGQSIDVSAFPNGTYIVEMSGKTGVSRERIVKI